MQSQTLIRVGAVFGALAVTAGAFGAHELENIADARQLQNWDTGAQYMMYHALALVLCGLLRARGFGCGLAGWSFVLGTAIFSGTLYGLGLNGPKWLGAITPIGGVLLIVGWGALASAGRSPAAPD